MKIGKGLKILLVISLILNLALGSFQIFKYFEKKQRMTDNKNRLKRFTEQRLVNSLVEKKNFFDTLFLNYPELKTKKYLFMNIWRTADAYSDRVLPIYDTIILPLRNDVGYVTVTEEKEKYAKSVLKKDTGLIKNFLFVFNSENFVLAVNQELKLKFRKFFYPYYPDVIFDNQTKKIIFFDTVGISGPKYPQDSLSDKKVIAAIKKALSELK
jgi:hypothetical protein